MVAVERTPGYVAETRAAVARLQEMTTPAQYEALVGRAERLVEGLFSVEVRLERELMVKIALRERFERERVKRAILSVATWRLIEGLADGWSVRKRPARRPVAAAPETAAPETAGTRKPVLEEVSA